MSLEKIVEQLERQHAQVTRAIDALRTLHPTAKQQRLLPLTSQPKTPRFTAASRERLRLAAINRWRKARAAGRNRI
jgi:hypothetical protein